MANYEAFIVGGGVIGLSIARELARRGLTRIAIAERGKIGREASFAAAGMLAPNAENEVVDDLYRLCDASRQMFPDLAGALLDETRIDIELDRAGTIYAAFTSEDQQHLETRFGRQVAAAIPVERLSASEVLTTEPHLSDKVRESLYFPNDWQVENRKMLAALEASVRSLKIEIVEGGKVDSLTMKSGRVGDVTVNGSRHYADNIILATGAWTSLIKIGYGQFPLGVRPIRGQMLSFAPSAKMFRNVIYSPRGYLVPRRDGRILVGATVEDVGFDDKISAEAGANLRKAAFEIAPALSATDVADHWAGLRPYADGGSPIIGAFPGCDGLFVATAHYRNGILLAPITAKLMGERLVDGITSEYFDIFGPEQATARQSNANG